jgi:hypothetical protein
MPANRETINRELYGLLKSRGYKPHSYDSSGQSAPVPDEADFFQFDFIKDGKSYGKVTITIDGLHRMIVYYGDSVEKSPKASTHDSISFTDLRKQLKRMAFTKRLGFELKDEDDLEPDMQKRQHIQKEEIHESYHPMGKKASYNDSVPKTKILIKHSRALEEGEQRFRNIDKIFVENAMGERFLLPTKKPGVARVYARHISEGGTPYDERGQHITSMIEEYQKMAGFVNATRKKQFNEDVQTLVTEGVNHYMKLRETLHKMAGQRGYREYFENYTPALMEDETSEDLSEMFKTSSLDPRIESAMPILSKLKKNPVKETTAKHIDALESWADDVIEGEDDKIGGRYEPDEFDQMVKRVGEKAKQNPVPFEKLAKRMQDAYKKQNPNNLPNSEKKTDEGMMGAALGGVAGAALTKTPAGAMAGANIGSSIQDELTSESTPPGKPGDYFGSQDKVTTGKILGNKLQNQKGLQGKLVGESDDLALIKKLSGLKK